MIATVMNIKSVVFASVSSVLLAASVAANGSPAAAQTPVNATIAVAYSALAKGQPKKAVAGFSEAIESGKLTHQDRATALLNRGLAYQRLKQHQQSVDDYSAALKLQVLGTRMRAVALYNRGLSQQKIGQSSLAIEDFTNALFLDVGFSQAYYSRANVLRRSGQYLFALSDYEKAVKYKHPQAHLPLFGQALTYEALNREDKRDEAFEKSSCYQAWFFSCQKETCFLGRQTKEQTARDTKQKTRCSSQCC